MAQADHELRPKSSHGRNRNDSVSQAVSGKSRDFQSQLAAGQVTASLGPIHWLLGIEVTHDCDTHTISLCQSSFIDTILACFSLADAKPYGTPMVPSTSYSKHDSPSSPTDVAHMCKVPYCEAIGSLMYVAIATRPDISFAVSCLSQFLENLGEAHWQAVKHVFHYLAGTWD